MNRRIRKKTHRKSLDDAISEVAVGAVSMSTFDGIAVGEDIDLDLTGRRAVRARRWGLRYRMRVVRKWEDSVDVTVYATEFPHIAQDVFLFGPTFSKEIFGETV